MPIFDKTPATVHFFYVRSFENKKWYHTIHLLLALARMIYVLFAGRVLQ